MKEKTKAYLAGILDAEGCFEISKWYSKRQERDYIDIYLDITNEDKSLLEWVTFNFGGTFKKAPRKLKSGEVRMYYNWRIKNRSHLKFIVDSVYPYLFIKRMQADIFKSWFDLKGKPNKALRSEMSVKIQELNQGSVTTEMPSSLNSKYVKPYLAGLFDGDGSICLPYGVSFSNICLPAHDLFKKYGGAITKDKPKEGHHSSYHWQLSGGENQELFLLAVLPYLVIKKQKGQTMLNIIRSREKIQSDLVR